MGPYLSEVVADLEVGHLHVLAVGVLLQAHRLALQKHITTIKPSDRRASEDASPLNSGIQRPPNGMPENEPFDSWIDAASHGHVYMS